MRGTDTVPVKTHYDVLGIGPGATADEIKQAFRRQIALYHPDKVQDLGPEIQEVAAERAREIMRAHRELSSPGLRAAYDRLVAAAPPASSVEPAGQGGSNRDAHADGPAVEPPPSTRSPDLFHQDQVSWDFVRRAALDRLRQAVAAELVDGEEIRQTGFDVVYRARQKRGLLRRKPALMICGRLLPRVDADAVRTAWDQAVRLGGVSRELCLFLIGDVLAPRRELAGVIANLTRRLSQVSSTSITVIAIDVHDWQGLVAVNTPSPARRVLDRLRQPS